MLPLVSIDATESIFGDRTKREDGGRTQDRSRQHELGPGRQHDWNGGDKVGLTARIQAHKGSDGVVDEIDADETQHGSH
jgi:hypothetical protein